MQIELKNIAHELRVDILKMYYKAGWGHLAPAFSCVDILTVLYWGNIINRDKLFEEDHDRFILSKGHACASLYAVLSRLGYFSREDLATFYQKNSIYIGLASSKVNGIDISTGSLGHGICFATGTALAAKLEDKGYKTYVILGDGESQEGSVWEAALFAGHYHLDNLIVILDNNKLQGSDWIESIVSIQPIRDKWEAFGWNVDEADGHNFEELKAKLQRAKENKGKPSLLIANTIKGKGVSIAENNPAWHSRAPKGKEWESACADLGISLEDLEKL